MSRPSAQLKTPKGTRDWVGDDLLLRESILFVRPVLAAPRPRQTASPANLT